MAKVHLCQKHFFLLAFGICGLVVAEQNESTACIGGIDITSESGWFSSPGYDGEALYAKNLECFWRFKAPTGTVYHFSFKAFDVESYRRCSYDILVVTEYYNETGIHTSRDVERLCGSRLPKDITATVDSIAFRFHTDEGEEHTGFNITYDLFPAPCPDRGLWKCGEEDRCINQSMLCDGVEDCANGTDEIVCPNSKDCGISTIPQRLTSPRILGGEVSVEGSWPWMAALFDDPKTFECGATIVHPRWVITAAHCFVLANIKNPYVIAGKYNRTKKNRNEQKMYVNGIFMLKTFNTEDKRDDIAVLRLKEPLNMTDYVKTACFPSGIMKDGNYGWLVGWGWTHSPRYNERTPCCENRLKQVIMPVINKELCNSNEYYHGQVLRSMICAGYAEGRIDGCDGDSGGPFLKQRSADDSWELQGVMSWGIGCGRPKHPSVYTVVYDYLFWIRRTIADNSL